MTKLAVALSGGRDSVYLLHRLTKRAIDLSSFGIEDYELSAIYVHHKIREEADEDVAFVTKLCKKWHVPLSIVYVDAPQLAETEKLSLEDAARRLRYDALEQADADIVALAHHKKDQVETVLMHLLRGAGLKGLTGMRVKSKLRPNGMTYIRPLLNVSREEINEYIAENNLAFREDETNEQLVYLRNRVRLSLLPLLKEGYNPNIEDTLCDMARVLASEEEALQTFALEAYQKMGGRLEAKAFARYPLAIQKRLFDLYYAKTMNADFEPEGDFTAGIPDFGLAHYEMISRLAFQQNGTKIDLPGNLTVIKDCDIISIQNYLDATTPNGAADFLFTQETAPDWSVLKSNAKNECYLSLLAGEALKEAVLRHPKNGDYIYIEDADKKPVRKLLSDLFTDAKISQQERAQTYVLASGSEALWVTGIRVNARYYVNEEAQEAQKAPVKVFHIQIQ